MFLDRVMWATEWFWAQDIAWKGTDIVNSSMGGRGGGGSLCIMAWLCNLKQYSCQKKENRLNRAVNSKKFYFLQISERICAFSVVVLLPQHTCADFLQLPIFRQNDSDNATFSDFILLKAKKKINKNNGKASYKYRTNRKQRNSELYCNSIK